MGRELDAATLGLDVRSLAETLAARLDAARGPTRLEFEYEDGRLLRVHRHEKIGVASLARFDEPAEPNPPSGS